MVYVFAISIQVTVQRLSHAEPQLTQLIQQIGPCHFRLGASHAGIHGHYYSIPSLHRGCSHLCLQSEGIVELERGPTIRLVGHPDAYRASHGWDNSSIGSTSSTTKDHPHSQSHWLIFLLPISLSSLPTRRDPVQIMILILYNFKQG